MNDAKRICCPEPVILRQAQDDKVTDLSPRNGRVRDGDECAAATKPRFIGTPGANDSPLSLPAE